MVSIHMCCIDKCGMDLERDEISSESLKQEVWTVPPEATYRLLVFGLEDI